MEQRALTEMAKLLDSDGINYSVFLKAYSGAVVSTSDVGDIVNGLLGDGVVISGVRDLDTAEVIEDVSQCLGYVGDEGAGPGPNTLRSAELSNLLKNILESVMQLSETSYGIKSFRFEKGHPAYPVFWDFAFLFLRSDEHVLFVGASSD